MNKIPVCMKKERLKRLSPMLNLNLFDVSDYMLCDGVVSKVLLAKYWANVSFTFLASHVEALRALFHYRWNDDVAVLGFRADWLSDCLPYQLFCCAEYILPWLRCLQLFHGFQCPWQYSSFWVKNAEQALHGPRVGIISNEYVRQNIFTIWEFSVAVALIELIGKRH